MGLLFYSPIMCASHTISHVCDMCLVGHVFFYIECFLCIENIKARILRNGGPIFYRVFYLFSRWDTSPVDTGIFFFSIFFFSIYSPDGTRVPWTRVFLVWNALVV